MSKYCCCFFPSYEDLEKTLKKVDKSSDALIIAQSLEARCCPGSWIRSAYDKYYELYREEH